MLGSETGLKDQVSTVLIPETNINANDTKINGVNMKRNICPVLAFETTIVYFIYFFQFCLLICTFNPFSEIIKIISVEYLRFTTELNTSTTYNTDKIFMVWIKTLFVWFQSCLMSFCSCLRYYN